MRKSSSKTQRTSSTSTKGKTAKSNGGRIVITSGPPSISSIQPNVITAGVGTTTTVNGLNLPGISAEFCVANRDNQPFLGVGIALAPGGIVAPSRVDLQIKPDADLTPDTYELLVQDPAGKSGRPIVITGIAKAPVISSLGPQPIYINFLGQTIMLIVSGSKLPTRKIGYTTNCGGISLQLLIPGSDNALLQLTVTDLSKLPPPGQSADFTFTAQTASGTATAKLTIANLML